MMVLVIAMSVSVTAPVFDSVTIITQNCEVKQRFWDKPVEFGCFTNEVYKYINNVTEINETKFEWNNNCITKTERHWINTTLCYDISFKIRNQIYNYSIEGYKCILSEISLICDSDGDCQKGDACIFLNLTDIKTGFKYYETT